MFKSFKFSKRGKQKTVCKSTIFFRSSNFLSIKTSCPAVIPIFYYPVRVQNPDRVIKGFSLPSGLNEII
jgi:hypothetical protein